MQMKLRFLNESFCIILVHFPNSQKRRDSQSIQSKSQQQISLA